MLIVSVLGLIAAMLAFPDTDIGRGLRHWFVEQPARMSEKVRGGPVAFYLLLGLLGAVLILLFEAEGARLFGFMVPDTVIWFTMFDVGVFMDVFLIGTALAAANGLRVVRAQMNLIAGRLVRLSAMVTPRIRIGARARRHPPTTPRPSRSDDDRPAGSEWSFGGQAIPYRSFNIA